jgi:hypothetical protein
MSEWEVHLGTLNLVGAQTASDGRVVLTSSIARVHDDFDILENANAVAVIKLPTAVTISGKQIYQFLQYHLITSNSNVLF